MVKALQDLGSGAKGQSARQLLACIPVQMGTGNSGGKPHTGHLQLIDNQVDAKSGTVRVRAVFDNADGALIPGQLARIRMGQARNTQAVLINERAVGTDQSKKFVMVVAEGNKAEYREVTLGAQVWCWPRKPCPWRPRRRCPVSASNPKVPASRPPSEWREELGIFV